MADRFPELLGSDRIIKQLSQNIVISICQCLADQLLISVRLRQITDLLASDKSRYFAQPRPIIVNYFDIYADQFIAIFSLKNARGCLWL